jgi:hypothetical protein
MFEYAKIKAELEQIKCPVHAKAATVVFADGKMTFENVCCEEHRKKLEAALPDLESLNTIDLLAEMY